MWNEALIIGYVGRDPEIRTTNNGDRCANLSIATSEHWKDKNGDRQEKTEWHRIVVWGKLAEIVEDHVHKGMLLGVRGKIQTRKWIDKDSNEKYTTEIVLSGFDAKLKMFGKKNGESDGDDGEERSSRRGRREQPAEDLDDEIPF
jgi:single-strand DNA-binding protein